MHDVKFLVETLDRFFQAHPDVPEEVKETFLGAIRSRVSCTPHTEKVNVQASCCTEDEQWLSNFTAHYTEVGNARYLYRITGLVSRYELPPDGFSEED